MDRLNERHRKIEVMMDTHFALYAGNTQGIPYYLVKDPIQRHLILVSDGWIGEQRFYGVLVHIEVQQNGMVRVHEDNTELGIVDELLDMGIPADEIVIGWHSPSMREDTAFAPG